MSTDNVEQPVKRKSVADMWREREQALLDKKDQPYKATASPARRPLKNFEEKKVEGAVAATTNDSTNAETSASSNQEAAPSKTASTNAGEASTTTTRRPLSTKSKFAMMGQKHAARPKKLASYQKYQQPAKKNNAKSPNSTNSDAILAEAFDDAVSAQEGNKLSAELSSRRRAPQSDGAEPKPSEYSSLQVSDSASIPKDVHPKVSTDNNDDESNISGLSSPGSPARSSRNQRRSKAMPETPEQDNNMEQESFDSEVFSAGASTVTPRSAESPGLDVVSEAVVADGFVEERDNQVSAFQDAMQKMSLEDIAKDMKEEATAVFDGLNIGSSMAAASEKFSSLFAKKEEAPVQADKSAEAGETPTEGDAAATPAENSETPENAEPKPENAEEEPATETTEAVTETAEPATEDVQPRAAVAEPVEPVATETPETATEETAPALKSDGVADAPDPPLETADSSEVFDPFASSEPADFADFAAFSDDAFSSNFAAPAPAPKPAQPILPKKELSPQRKPVSSPPRRKAPPAQEEVAIEVEYLEDSDDDQADV